MMLNSHYVFFTNAAFSHCQSAIALINALVTLTPDLCVSVILHANNEENAQRLFLPGGEDIEQRVKLFPVGEVASSKDQAGAAMTMAYKAGEVYAKILMVSRVASV